MAIAAKYKRATLNMSRVLFLLSWDRIENNGAGPDGPVITAFGRFADQVPLWVWLMWIPQLLSSLARWEGVYVRKILMNIARIYPQSIYYTMRAYLIEQRDLRQSAQQLVAMQQQQLQQQQAAQAAQQAAQAAAAAQAAQAAASAAAPASSSDDVKKAKTETDGAAMTDVASSAASSSTTAPASSSTAGPGAAAADGSATAAAAGTQAQANTSQASFVSGTPAALAKPQPNVPVQPLRGDAANQAAAEGDANQAASAAASSSTSAPAAPGGPQPPPPSQQQPPQQAPPPPPHPGVPDPSGRVRAEFGPNQSMQWVEEVFNVLRRSHPSLTTEIEKVLDELSRRFKPEPEEELYNAVFGLTAKAFKQGLTPLDCVSSDMHKAIERICKKFFGGDLQPSLMQRKHIAFVQRYKASFEADFAYFLTYAPGKPVVMQDGQPKLNPLYPTTMNDLLMRLQRWKAHLSFIVSSASHTELQLERLSPYLVKFNSWDIEIPGQYIHDREPTTDQHALLQRFSRSVNVQHAHGFSNRRIAMLSDDGKPHHFLVQYQISHITRSDERMMQLYVLLNRMMRHYRETRKRQLVYNVPAVIPLTHRLRLTETDPAQVSLEDIYEQSCAMRGADPDAPHFTYRESMKRAAASLSGPSSGGSSSSHEAANSTALVAARLRVYTDICSRLVPDTILQRYIHETLPAADQLFVFKSQLCAQLALSGFLSYLLKIGERHLHRISLFRQTGKLSNSEFYPQYNAEGLIENNEPIPFRLSRNLSTALSPVLIDGLFTSVLMSTNSCLLTDRGVLENYLLLFLRDDLFSWHTTKHVVDSDHTQRALEAQARDKVAINTNNVIKRIHMLMPGNSGNHLSLNHKIHLLVKVATSKQKLSTMGPQWSPWF
jgi:transformation/transcription domain-associated protein